MRIAYFDCFSGASGDMILGALLNAGLELTQLRKEINKLHLTHFEIKASEITKRGIGAVRAEVTVDEDHHGYYHRNLHDIRQIINKSDLGEKVKHKSLEIFANLARAEAKVHRTKVDQIHFHEVGAMDSIVDVVGSVTGLEFLGIEEVFCSPLHVGAGTVECAHGTLPVPAPATIELIRDTPVYSTGVTGELLTPTGAAILTTLASGFGPMPYIILKASGYGAGASEFSIPNLLRVIIGETEKGKEFHHPPHPGIFSFKGISHECKP